jgi:2,4-dienoyl-CoA reductase-like NADH-dependent reductase (Old Yellow Enzyme family)/thioredoxin reductase
MKPAGCEHLFQPLAIGSTELPNRIVSTSHQTNLVRDHLPTEDFVAYHARRARGGVGLIVLEATAVHESGLLHPHTLAGYREEIADGYRAAAAAVKPHGARLFVQLFHGGREQIASAPRAPVLAPSAIPTQRFKVEPRALRAVEIQDIVDGYAAAARLAAQGGLDGVEISAAHEYLVAQFFTPGLNTRTDEWAVGPAFLFAVIAAVRAAAPGLAVGVRLTADSRPAQSFAPELAGRVDYLSLTTGRSSTYAGSAWIVPPPPTDENAIESLTESFRVGPPIVATGRIVDPLAADRIVAEGRADAVGMTRALIADPDLPRKVKAREPLLRCIGCNACIAHYHAGTPIACAQNPRTGRERTLPPPGGARASRRLVVVGAGPAGLAAAAEARAAGHAVIVLERRSVVGGQITLAGAAPAHAETATNLRANYDRLLAGAELRLSTEATREALTALEPDAVVVATGARPYMPALDLGSREVLQAWDVLAGARPASREVVVVDWSGDATGMASAELLLADGYEVTVAVAALVPGEAVHQFQRAQYLERLYRAGVRFEHHTTLEVDGGGRAVLSNLFTSELRQPLPAGAVVLALGRVPEDSLAPALEADGLRVEEAGDCRSPRSLEEAVLEGTMAARRLLEPG